MDTILFIASLKHASVLFAVEMNTLKKFVQSQTNASSTPPAAATPAKNPAANSQDYALSLQHLKRVFQECLVRGSAGNSTVLNTDERLYSLIPIFVKVQKIKSRCLFFLY